MSRFSNRYAVADNIHPTHAYYSGVRYASIGVPSARSTQQVFTYHCIECGSSVDADSVDPDDVGALGDPCPAHVPKTPFPSSPLVGLPSGIAPTSTVAQFVHAAVMSESWFRASINTPTKSESDDWPTWDL